jgi:hypothetical protein
MTDGDDLNRRRFEPESSDHDDGRKERDLSHSHLNPNVLSAGAEAWSSALSISELQEQNRQAMRSSSFYFPLIPSETEASLKSKTLLLPVVSTANIAQLAVDLIISTLGLTRLGILDDRHLVPAVGARENGESGVTLPLECRPRFLVNVYFFTIFWGI